jgi:hypothetical protein
MKSLAIMIALGAFVAVAFVPPTQENLQANAAFVASLGERGINVAHAATAVQELAGKAVTAVSGAFATPETRQLLESAKQQAAEEVKKAVTKQVSGTIQKAIGAAPKIQPLRKQLTAGELSVYKSHVQTIESAVSTGNVRTCRALADAQSGELANAPSAADFMVLCIAMVTGDPNRCVQIDAEASSPPLHSICERQTAL